ncbi:16357_t:CDS:10 [Dentiscutata erythropus]|uniref:16357_t:CDS:1 n=1 Tax=Dentiscutata erythropus TaxID=1348616 RepID=A0A9N9BJU2_9GLOM|nr:16357_t:CDS:10 [Dentiscutata erythropus]
MSEIIDENNELNHDIEKDHRSKKETSALLTLSLAFKSIGIIYGDIGTSPLYVFTGIFSDPPTDPQDVYGALSLIIWSLTIVPLIKYVFIVLRADDHGEGGTFALYSLLCRHSGLSVRGNENSDDLTIANYDTMSIISSKEHPNFIKRSKTVQSTLLIVVLLGSSLVMSDGLLTPAISVISAVEGMEIPAPSLESGIVPLSCIIIVLLFMVQQFGTAKVGSLFAPIVALWFIALSCIGIWNITYYPRIFEAFNPYHAINYFIRNQGSGFTDLGGVLLAITGVEALFADLGHFNRRAIQISFPCFVYLPLVLVYSGQAARLVVDPSVIANTFWRTTPNHPVVYWIVFVLAILATIIASQAMISATFSLIYQSMQLDCFPDVKVIHTSKKVTAVASVMIITTALLAIVIHQVWHLPIFVSVIFFLIFGTVDASFLGATLRKVENGGWLTLLVAICLAIIMIIWRWGTVRKIRYELIHKPNLGKIFENSGKPEKPIPSSITINEDSQISQEVLHQDGKVDVVQLRLSGSENHLTRSSGIGLFYSGAGSKVPLSFSHFIKHFPIVPQNLVFITIRPIAVPIVGDNDRLIVKKVGNYECCYHATARYGYSEEVSQGKDFILKLVESIQNIDPSNKTLKKDFDNIDDITYVLGEQSFYPRPGSSWWRRSLVRIYTVLVVNSRKQYDNLDIPVENTIGVGMKIAL